MTNQSPNADTSREPGYRGTLPMREDRLARPWILAVIAIFVLVLVLSVAGIPSRFIPDPTLPPVPSIPIPSFSAQPSASGSASASSSGSTSASASGSAEASASTSGSESASPSASASP